MGGDLNDTGKWQARQLALRLQDEFIDYVYCSDLKRAVDTAAEVIKFNPDVSVQYTSILRERSLGIYEGKPKGEWREAIRAITAPFHLFRPMGGESYEEVRHRIYEFYQMLLVRHPDDTVLLVTHGGILTMLYLTLFKKPLNSEQYERYRPENTALTIGEFRADTPIQIEMLNSIEHLLVSSVVH